MTICLCGDTALKCWRGSNELIEQLSSASRTSKLGECSLMRRKEVEKSALSAGLRFDDEPVHLMVGLERNAHAPQGIVRHVRSADLPARSFVRLSKEVLVSSPELLFSDLSPKTDEIGLALIGCELCGTYTLDPDSDAGFRTRSAPLMTVASITRFLSDCGQAKGVTRARKALQLVMDGSRSPMETALALMLSAPRRLGGMAFEQPKLNWPVRTSDGVKRVDVCWPDHGFGLEYLGRPYHDGPKAEARDGRREGKLLASGMRIIDVRYEDVRSPSLFDSLVRTVGALLGVRVRVRFEDFRTRQAHLRARVLPPLQQEVR